MEKSQYKGPERRCYNRIKYNPTQRAKLQIETDVFEVVDISENGLRFTNDKEMTLDKSIRGTLTFLNGEVVDIAGIVEWEKDNNFGIQFKIRIPSDMIINEILHLSKNTNVIDPSEKKFDFNDVFNFDLS
jgi:hypothetical protein